MPKLPPASTRNPAFQSKLEPYREFIRECRAKRWSYPRIAAALQETHGLSRCSEHHLFLRQSARQAAQPLRASALGRCPSFPIQLSKPQGAGLFHPARTKGNT